MYVDNGLMGPESTNCKKKNEKNESCLELYKSSKNATKMQNAKKVKNVQTQKNIIILVLVLVLLLSLLLPYPPFWGLLYPPQRAPIRLQLHSQHTCLSTHRLHSQHQILSSTRKTTLYHCLVSGGKFG